MLPRLVFATLILAVLGTAGYGVARLIWGRQPVPRAQALLDAGNPRGAQLVLRTVVKADPRNAEAHVLLARTQLDLSDPVAAEKELKIARALRFDRAAVNPLLGRAYLAQERYQDVLADFPATIGGSELLQNLVIRSTAYLALGELGQASASVEQATRLDPDEPSVLLARARVASAGNDTAAAEVLLDRAAERVPNSLELAMLRVEVLLKQGKGKEAKAAMDKAVSSAPYSIAARLQRANYLIAQGDLKGARADVDASFDVDWHDTALLMTNAVLMMQSGRLGDAEVEFQRLAAYFDRHPRGYYYQALTASRLEHNEVALDYVYRYLKVQPRNVDGLRLAANLELRLGRSERARDIVERAAQIGVKDAQLLDTLGRAYFMQGNTAAAIESFGKASTLDPGNKDIASHLAAAQSLAAPGAAPAAAGMAAGLGELQLDTQVQ